MAGVMAKVSNPYSAPAFRLPSVTSRSAAGLPPSYRCVL
jgi:hypothetical protein